MKIIVNEEQFKRIILENIEDLGNNSPNPIPSHMGGNKVTSTVPVHNKDGEIETGEQPTTDKYAQDQTSQSSFNANKMSIRGQG